MSGQIGLRLFQQLKGIDAEVSRDDYFDEEHNTWDVEALEEDLKVTQDRLKQTGTVTLPHHTHEASRDPLLLNTVPNLMNHPINPHQINVLSLSNHRPTDPNPTNHALSTPINLDEPQQAPHHTLHPQQTQHIAIKCDEDIDLTRTVSSQQTTDTTPSQMPSPNASPSIEYDPSLTESDTDHMVHTPPNTHPNAIAIANRNAAHIQNTNPIHALSHPNGIQKAVKKGKKRKAEVEIHSVSKKRKIEPHHILNKWNEVALKKLFTLKRAVKNSAWFWEPVNEVKHSAPHYYLVCPMPSDYGTICTKLERYGYYDLDEFLRDCELVFINARLYNTAVHAVHEASMSLEKKFKDLMNTFVCQHYEEYGSKQTLVYWQKAKKNFKPFAVPKECRK